jgi:hypothetical protein
MSVMRISERKLVQITVYHLIFSITAVSSQYYYERLAAVDYMSSSSDSVYALSSGPTDATNHYFLVSDDARRIAAIRIQQNAGSYSLGDRNDERNCQPSRSRINSP